MLPDSFLSGVKPHDTFYSGKNVCASPEFQEECIKIFEFDRGVEYEFQEQFLGTKQQVNRGILLQ